LGLRRANSARCRLGRGARQGRLARSHEFRTGLNEDLAATAIRGSKYVSTFPGATLDGVFGLWYGKGPGVDRSGDALRPANLAGTSSQGGVLAIARDDHSAKSSTVANFSDQVFSAVGMPVLYPSNTQNRRWPRPARHRAACACSRSA